MYGDTFISGARKNGTREKTIPAAVTIIPLDVRGIVSTTGTMAKSTTGTMSFEGSSTCIMRRMISAPRPEPVRLKKYMLPMRAFAFMNERLMKNEPAKNGRKKIR